MGGARLAVFALAMLASGSSAWADIVGRATVVDGDTIEIRGQRIRLFGIDAPESSQICYGDTGEWRCGQSAALTLQSRISSNTVNCRERDHDRYGRVIAVCTVGGENINAWLVAEGWALAYRDYSTDFIDLEDAARQARKGVWRGSFVAPWEWRQGKRQPNLGTDKTAESSNVVATASCRIKGNISVSGERIYHLPGGQYYDATLVNPAKGERWFCTEAQARDAGWRKSKR